MIVSSQTLACLETAIQVVAVQGVPFAVLFLSNAVSARAAYSTCHTVTPVVRFRDHASQRRYPPVENALFHPRRL